MFDDFSQNVDVSLWARYFKVLVIQQVRYNSEVVLSRHPISDILVQQYLILDVLVSHDSVDGQLSFH